MGKADEFVFAQCGRPVSGGGQQVKRKLRQQRKAVKRRRDEGAGEQGDDEGVGHEEPENLVGQELEPYRVLHGAEQPKISRKGLEIACEGSNLAFLFRGGLGLQGVVDVGLGFHQGSFARAGDLHGNLEVVEDGVRRDGGEVAGANGVECSGCAHGRVKVAFGFADGFFVAPVQADVLPGLGAAGTMNQFAAHGSDGGVAEIGNQPTHRSGFEIPAHVAEHDEFSPHLSERQVERIRLALPLGIREGAHAGGALQHGGGGVGRSVGDHQNVDLVLRVVERAQIGDLAGQARRLVIARHDHGEAGK